MQLVLQSYVFVTVLRRVEMGTASPADTALYDFVQPLPFSITTSSVAILKTWIELVLDARKTGVDVPTKALSLWEIGEGLPLDAIKRDALVTWVCPRAVEEDEVEALVAALAQVCALPACLTLPRRACVD